MTDRLPDDRDAPAPDELRHFTELLLQDAPDGYEPWLFRCEKQGKAPALEFGSWKDEKNNLTPDEAVDAMQDGYNIGIAGMDGDRLVNVDIDDDDATDPDQMKATLMARSRSRSGWHAWYFAEPGEEVSNIPTDDKGEVRANGQYVLAPGSYVPTDSEEVPDGQEDYAGYYTVEREQEVAAITPDELPEVFQFELHQSTAQQQLQEADEDKDGDSPDFEGNSDVFDVTAQDVVIKEGGSPEPGDRWSSLFHGSDTDANMSISEKGVLQCWRHSVSHSGFQALVTLSDHPGTCQKVGSPHKGSGAGPSSIKSDDAAVWHAWKYAKENGYIPEDDRVPYRALKHICRERELCPASEIPKEYDPENGQRLPDYGYNAAIESIENKDGLETGRDRTDEMDDSGTGDIDPEPPQPGKSLSFGMVLDRAPSEPGNDRERAYYGYEVIQNHPDHNFLATFDGQLYYYQSGRWIPDGKQKLRQLGTELFEASWGANLLSETKEQIRSKDAIRREELGTPKRTVAVKNGLLHVDTGELDPHDKDHLALNKLPVEYDPDAEAPRWRQFLKESVEDGMQDAVEEYLGYTLLEGEMPFARALLLVGGGSNGKSTFLNTVIELLGEENITGFSLGDLSHNEYYAAEMFGALANVDADVTGGIGHGGMFKKLTGGDRKVSARRPYGEPFDFHPTTKQLYSANKVPDAEVDDDAFFRRWLIVEFPTEFTDSHLEGPDKDPNLEDKLMDELPGILNRAVDGAQRLLEQGHFTNEGEIYEKRERWQEWGNTVDKFLSNCVETGGDGKIKSGELHSIYTDYCRAELGEEPESQATLTGEMKKQDGVKYSSDFRFNGKKGRGFKGVNVTWKDAEADTSDTNGQARLPQADMMDKVTSTIQTHQGQNGDLADVEEVLDKLEDTVGRNRAEKAIKKLGDRGAIHEPEAGRIELID